ncbi:MAG: NAD(P)-dependent glycerol-3-phosphate dehydrogenase, partial [Alphaproteobacteria bacterium]|nr:NAD(P)-dependent glycerol-3-phosphate dehydrogenase [Alphaproteobacteria bacterium]
IAECDLIVLAVPAQAIRSAVKSIEPFITKPTLFVLASKGIELSSGKLMSEVIEEILPIGSCAVLSGPSFAKEVAGNLPTASTIAAEKSSEIDHVIDALGSRTFRLYGSKDMIGLQIAGALKNVLAIGSGFVTGKGFGENARAALITRGLFEMTQLGLSLGAKAETFMGLSGLGDLLLTTMGDQSRNMTLGKALGKGSSLSEIMENQNQVTEGVYTADSLQKIADKAGVEMPICTSIRRVLNGEISASDAVELLLSRPYGKEEVDFSQIKQSA